MSLGSKIKQLRTKKKESLQKVADGVGVSKPHIWELEQGKSSNPSIGLIQKLSDHFGVDAAYFLSEESDQDDGVVQFYREFKNLPDEDWELLRSMAGRIKEARGEYKK